MGIDCVGLLICAGADIGIEVPDMQGYRRSPQPEAFLGHIRDNSDPISNPAHGCFGIFRDGTQPCHVGVFCEIDEVLYLVHAYAGTGVVMEEPFIHHWPGRLIETRCLRGLD